MNATLPARRMIGIVSSYRFIIIPSDRRHKRDERDNAARSRYPIGVISANAPTVAVDGLTFRYPRDQRLALDDLRFTLSRGERCLLLGRNGAGKSTLLHVIGGKHMVPPDKVRVLGRPAFHDTSLAGVVTFLGGPFPFDVDITVGEVLVRTPHVDRAREARLVDVLGVDRDWHMHRV